MLHSSSGIHNTGERPQKLEPLFPNAIITLDVCHVVEKLWELGHRFHKEGSEELKAWVEELKELVYQGRGPSHGTSSVADSCLRNSSGVILRNSQKLNAGNFRPKRPYGV